MQMDVLIKKVHPFSKVSWTELQVEMIDDCWLYKWNFYPIATKHCVYYQRSVQRICPQDALNPFRILKYEF